MGSTMTLTRSWPGLRHGTGAGPGTSRQVVDLGIRLVAHDHVDDFCPDHIDLVVGVVFRGDRKPDSGIAAQVALLCSSRGRAGNDVGVLERRPDRSDLRRAVAVDRRDEQKVRIFSNSLRALALNSCNFPMLSRHLLAASYVRICLNNTRGGSHPAPSPSRTVAGSCSSSRAASSQRGRLPSASAPRPAASALRPCSSRCWALVGVARRHPPAVQPASGRLRRPEVVSGFLGRGGAERLKEAAENEEGRACAVEQPEVATVVEREISDRRSAETVFEFFVDPQKICQWKGRKAELDLSRRYLPGRDQRRGDRARRVRRDRLAQPRGVHVGQGQESGEHVVPPGSSRVEVDLTPDGEGTLVRSARHLDLPEQSREIHGQGWDWHSLA